MRLKRVIEAKLKIIFELNTKVEHQQQQIAALTKERDKLLSEKESEAAKQSQLAEEMLLKNEILMEEVKKLKDAMNDANMQSEETKLLLETKEKQNNKL